MNTSVQAASPKPMKVDPAVVFPQEFKKAVSEEFSLQASSQENFSLTSESSPEIEELARSLKNDVDLIYSYVHDHIEYVPSFGIQKGPVATNLDGAGNAFEQSALAIALLREAGYDARFVYGTILLNPSQITNWLGTTDDPMVVYRLLFLSGVPHTVYTSDGTPEGDLVYVNISHIWVKVTIDDEEYVFDPSFKTYTYKTPINLPAAMGYDKNAFLAAALSGSTQTSDYIQNVNRANLRNALNGYALNLIDYIKENHSCAGLEEIIGGRSINPTENHLRQTALPHQEAALGEWTQIPDEYKTTLRIEHVGIDATLNTEDIYGKRLTLVYNKANSPILRIDGTVIATGNASPPGKNALILTVDHPYSAFEGTYADQSMTLNLPAGGSYAIVNGWTETSRDMVEKHRKILKQEISDGGGSLSEPVLGQTLALIGYTWLAQASTADKVSDQMANTFTVHHHWLGVCAQTQSLWIDMPMRLGNVITKDGDFDQELAGFYSAAGHQSAFEWGVLEQMQPITAVSTVKLLDMSNLKSDKIFNTTSANFFSTVRPQLINYDPGDLAKVDAYISAGYRLILPQNGAIGENQWSGTGYIAITPAEDLVFHIISGGLNGGLSTDEIDVDSEEASESGEETKNSDEHPQSEEPIDLVTGDYLYEHMDLSIGSAPYPFGLEFRRYYSSGNRLTDGALGWGWTHNFDITATAGSDAFQGFGEDSPIDAAATIVEQYVSKDILYANKGVERILIATLAHRWFMDQLIDNVVTIREAGNTEQFIKLPDGSYHPPPGKADILTKEPDNSYLLKTKYGIELDFGPNGEILTWKDPNNNTVNFGYSNGKLQTVSNGFARTLGFEYTDRKIDRVSDDTGRNITYSYDEAGDLISFTDANENTTTYEYDITGRMIKIFYPAHPSHPFVTNTYDSLGRIQTQTDAEENTYIYYFARYRSEETDPLGNSQILHFNKYGKTMLEIDALGNTTSYAYDGCNRQIKKTYPEGNSIEYEYDENYNVTKETVNPKPGSPDSPIINLYAHETVFNRIESFTDALGRTTSFSYDSKGNLIRIDLPQVNGQIPKAHYAFNAAGQVVSVTDPEGMVTVYSYDPVTGDLLSITVDHGRLDLITGFGYDPMGNISNLSDPRGNTTFFEYDLMRRPVQVTAPSPFNYIRKYTYDPQGRITRIERETGNALNPWQTVSMTYTLSGKSQTLTDAEEHLTSYEYDPRGRLWKVTDAENQTTQYLYDALGRLFQVIDAAGNTSEEYTYTANGKTASMKDARGNKTEYEYDGFDRPNKIIFPDDSHEAYTFDAAENLLQKRTRSGDVIAYQYDPMDRLKKKTLPGPIDTLYAYDLIGRLTEATNPNGTVSNQFDTAGRLSQTAYPNGEKVGYAYDASGNRTRLTYPDSYFITYTYDTLNRLTAILEENITPIVQYHYDALSRRTRLDYENSSSINYTYEDDSNLKGIENVFNGANVKFSYVFNAIGNRTEITVDNDSYLFNPLASEHMTHASNALNQYTSVEGIEFDYDTNGNLIFDGYNTYTHDIENRLVSASNTSHSATYYYDAFGRRIAKDVDGVVTDYLQDGDQVLAEYDQSGQIIRRYIYGPNIDEPICMRSDISTYYYHYDGAGSVIALTNDFGFVIERYTYTPFGLPDSTGFFGNPFFLTGRFFDGETGLYYYRSRYYDARLGRFLQIDPIGHDGGLNLYAYVGNNPLNWFDPFGFAPEFKPRHSGDYQESWDLMDLALEEYDHINRKYYRARHRSDKPLIFKKPGGRFKTVQEYALHLAGWRKKTQEWINSLPPEEKAPVGTFEKIYLDAKDFGNTSMQLLKGMGLIKSKSTKKVDFGSPTPAVGQVGEYVLPKFLYGSAGFTKRY